MRADMLRSHFICIVPGQLFTSRRAKEAVRPERFHRPMKISRLERFPTGERFSGLRNVLQPEEDCPDTYNFASERSPSVMTSSLPTDFWGRIIFLITNYSSSFLRGAGTTIAIAFVGTAVGCLIGFIVGIIQTIPINQNDSKIKKILLGFVNAILKIYVEVFRGTPMIVQAMFIYYGALMYLNISMGMWFAAFFIISINTGAYMAETVRGASFQLTGGRPGGNGDRHDSLPDDAVRRFPADPPQYHPADRQQPDHQYQGLLRAERHWHGRAVLRCKADSGSLLLVF